MNEVTSEDVESEKYVNSAEDLKDLDTEEEETEIAEEVLGEGISYSFAPVFSSVPVIGVVVNEGKEKVAPPVPVMIDVVNEGKEHAAPSLGRGEEVPKATISNSRPSARNVFDKKPKKGSLQQKTSVDPVNDFSEFGKDNLIPRVEEVM
ncbi:hypothetical protein U1Q18_040365 [Sarracenia purpurea var. burkii]